MEGDAYAQTPSTTFNRKKERGTYDAETIHNIINTTSVCHVSFTPSPSDPFPIILPMIGQIGQYSTDEAPACYLHGYVSSRLMKLGDTSSSSSPASPEQGLPVCVAATKVDGLTLALTPFNHSYNYRSAVLQGYASIVTEPDEKLWALELLTDAVVPDRWAHTRLPNAGEVAATGVLKVRIVAASAKVKGQVPSDERKDLQEESVVGKVWAGVVPVYERFGEPVPAPYNRVKEVPRHVSEFVRNENLNSEEYAAVVARREAPGRKKNEEDEDE